MAAWLRRQNKPELLELAEKTGVAGNIHAMHKADLVRDLDLHLQTTQKFRHDPDLSSYYSSLNRESPGRANTSAPRATATPEPKTASKPRRRQTNVGAAAESASDALEKAEATGKKTAVRAKKSTEGLMAKTPQSLQKLAARMPLPSSPQAVTSLVERTSARFGDSMATALERSGLPKATESTREMLGGAQAIMTGFALLEAFALNRALIPWRHAFNLTVPAVGTASVKLPDLFILLTSAYWSPVLLWSIVGLVLPTVVGWLFNISGTQSSSKKHKYAVDPVVFNATKAVALWVLYVQGWDGRDNWVDPRTAGTVDGAIIGGVPALFVGSLIAGTAGIWEGIVRGQR